MKAIDSPRTGHHALMLVLFGPSGAPSPWRRDASCGGRDPELFTDDRRTDEARAVCRDCPVRTRCLTDQLAWEDTNAVRRANRIGVVGGLTATERRHLSTNTNHADHAA